jgi:hypothetical protein
MPRIINDSRGQKLIDMRNKIPSDVYEFVKSNYGYDKDTFQERTTNCAITMALRELKSIKS